jgi:hypothetical protein
MQVDDGHQLELQEASGSYGHDDQGSCRVDQVAEKRGSFFDPTEFGAYRLDHIYLVRACSI